jgi:hypothetical protein
MRLDRLTVKGPRARAAGLALLLGVLLALAAPAGASAITFTVTGTGDGAAGTAGVGCPAGVGVECTLRAAIQGAKELPGPDTIAFDGAIFNGEANDTIAPAVLPAIDTPVTIDGTHCNAGSTVPCLSGTGTGGQPLLLFTAAETKLEHTSLSIPAGEVGIRASGSSGVGTPGVEILDNTVAMPGGGSPSTGIEVPFGSSGDLIEGNKFTASGISFDFPIALRGNSNRILGNEILGSGCCAAGITLALGASGNQIGGDTEASENLIQNFGGGAVRMENQPTDSSHNEVRRNHGENGLNFVTGASLAEPTIAEAKQSSVSGTAEPGAKVRLFRKKTENGGEIESFLGEKVADGTTGAWTVTFAKAPTGTLVAATQTLSGSTSGLGATKALAEEAETGGGGGGGGGGQTGGGTTTVTTPPATQAPPPPAVIAAPAPKKRKVKITKAPQKTSEATKVTFKFKAEPSAGAKFECKLDAAKWAGCRSPKTYKGIEPGRHTFRVRAKANGLTSAIARFKFVTNP